jgi:hypothetical protein
MILCFRCTAETRDELDKLIKSGAYQDYGGAIEAAVRNLVLMEKEVTEKGAIIIGDSGDLPPPPSPPPMAPDVHQLNGTVKERLVAGRVKGESTQWNLQPREAKVVERPQSPLEPAGVPPLFQLDGFPSEPPAGLADLPADMWSNRTAVPLDRWMLGQYNRLLPAKVNSRALIRLFLDNPKSLEIEAAASAIAAEAAQLGDWLRMADAKLGLARDDALATAFPTAEEGAEKGRSRYANQFVVYQNGKGELSGLMMDLKLINVQLVRKERRIVPTRVAWEFAAMRNPILDRDKESAFEKFSPEERAFLIAHIKQSVPVEEFAYRAILGAVQQGHTSPDQIDTALRVHLDEGRANRLSPSFLASQRSGAISRMSDLDLIERRREGVRVNYAATAAGMAFLVQPVSNAQG